MSMVGKTILSIQAYIPYKQYLVVWKKNSISLKPVQDHHIEMDLGNVNLLNETKTKVC